MLRSLEITKEMFINILGNLELWKIVEEKGGNRENAYEVLYIIQSLIKKLKPPFEEIKNKS